jgi:predicted anti-sigma-YlaC factor YlaD
MLRLFKKILGKGDVDCGEVRKNASDYLEQSLPSDRLAAIRAHLAGCGPCRSFIDTLSATIGLLSRIPPVTVPEGFRETVMRRVQREG